MRLVKLDLGHLARSLFGAAPSRSSGDTAFIKIVVQVIRAAK